MESTTDQDHCCWHCGSPRKPGSRVCDVCGEGALVTGWGRAPWLVGWSLLIGLAFWGFTLLMRVSDAPPGTSGWERLASGDFTALAAIQIAVLVTMGLVGTWARFGRPAELQRASDPDRPPVLAHTFQATDFPRTLGAVLFFVLPMVTVVAVDAGFHVLWGGGWGRLADRPIWIALLIPVTLLLAAKAVWAVASTRRVATIRTRIEEGGLRVRVERRTSFLAWGRITHAAIQEAGVTIGNGWLKIELIPGALRRAPLTRAELFGGRGAKNELGSACAMDGDRRTCMLPPSDAGGELLATLKERLDLESLTSPYERSWSLRFGRLSSVLLFGLLVITGVVITAHQVGLTLFGGLIISGIVLTAVAMASYGIRIERDMRERMERTRTGVDAREDLQKHPLPRLRAWEAAILLTVMSVAFVFGLRSGDFDWFSFLVCVVMLVSLARSLITALRERWTERVEPVDEGRPRGG